LRIDSTRPRESEGIVNEAVCEAIRRRRLIRLTYRGAERIVEPYLHGVRNNDTEVLVCFQRSGGSSSGTTTGWKALHVSYIEALEITDIAFVGVEPGFNPDGSSYNITRLHCLLTL
jgi:hypothetical protein